MGGGGCDGKREEVVVMGRKEVVVMEWEEVVVMERKEVHGCWHG